jgi:hypothetical protein
MTRNNQTHKTQDRFGMKKTILLFTIMMLVAATVLRGADKKALEALQEIGEEYKDFKVADASTASSLLKNSKEV